MSENDTPESGEQHDSLWVELWSHKIFRGVVIFSGLNAWHIGAAAHAQGIKTVSLLALIIGFFLVYSGALYSPITSQNGVAA